MEYKIKAFIEEILQEEDYHDCYLVELSLSGTQKVEVFLDSDSGMPFSKCQKISRKLEAMIEEQNLMDEKYTLEVSSPGIDRPLKFKRQYGKNVGRKLEVVDAEGASYEGKLTEVKEEGIILEYKERIKEGKKKKTVVIEKEILFENINKAIVKISF